MGSFKKKLLAGTALFAMLGSSTGAFAVAPPSAQILTSIGTWASAGTSVGTNIGDSSDATANDSIDIASFALNVINNQIANDGSGLDIFNLGAIIGTTGTITIDTGNATDLVVNISSISFSTLGAVGDLNISNKTNTTQSITSNIAGGVTLGGALYINNMATAAKTVNVSVASLSVRGTSTLSAGGFAGAASVSLVVNGSSTFSGGLTIKAGADIAASAILTLKGSSTGNITLEENASGLASIVFNGTKLQKISGSIDSNIAGKGDITINNTNGVTFNDNVGTTQLRKLVITSGNAVFSGSLNAVNTSIATTAILTTMGAATTAITFIGAGTANINGSLVGNIDFANKAGVVNLADGINIADNIDSSIASNGTVTFLGGATVTGKIGSTNALTAVNAGASVGKIVTFNSNVSTTVLNVNGIGSVALNGNLTGNLEFGINDGSVVLADTKNISGNVDAGAVNTGTLTINGNLNFLKTIGATNSLKVLNAGANNKIVTFNSSVKATTINVTGKGSVNFLSMGTGDLNFKDDGRATIKGGWTGSLDTGVANSGTVTFNTVAPVGVTTIGAIAPLKQIELSGVNLTTTGAVNAQKIIIGDNKINTTAAGFTLTSGQKVYFNASNSIGTSGRIILGGANVVNLQSGSTVIVSLNTGHSVAIGDNITLMTGGAVGSANGASVVSGTPGFSFVNVSAGNNFIVKVLAVTESSSQDNNLVNVSKALSAGDGLNINITNLNAAVDAAITIQSKNNLRASVMPTADRGISVSTATVATKVSSIIDNRVENIRKGYYTGMAGGSESSSKSNWVETYISSSIQAIRENIPGYNSRAVGLAFGYDSNNIIENTILGVSASYTLTSIHSKNSNSTSSNISSYGFGLYGNFNLASNIFLDGQIGYSYNDINIKRHDVGVIGGPTASGDTSSSEYFSKFAIGRDYMMANGMVLTTGVFASYFHLGQLSYTETGAGGLNMKVNTESSNNFDLGFALKSSAVLISNSGYLIKPEVKLGYSYDVINDKFLSTSKFTGNTAASFITTSADPSRNNFNAGIGLTYTSVSNWDLSAKYDFIFKKDYLSHNGSVRLTSHF